MKRLAMLVLVLVAPSIASAQSVRYRRPYAEGYRLNYGFDHSGGGGCSDYACGGACYDGHSGSDFGAPYGTTVLAAASGVVSATNQGCADYGGLGSTCGGRCGNYVQIRHDDGSYSIYCHMRNGSIRVGVGAHVACGQVLGQSASSGNSSGPHLHFGHRSPGSYSSSDPFAGSCSRSTTLWTGQGGYRDPPSTSCSCRPSGESCNGGDDDCDGRVDEGLATRCGTDVGECVSGTAYCEGGRWGACRGSVAPRAEECNGRDDDCDGASDEALTRACGTDVGECVAGVETCIAAAWGECAGAVWPVPEICDGLDNDCDGGSDSGRVCEREEVAFVSAVTGRTDSDADGDGRADACAASEGAFTCLLGSEHGLDRAIEGPAIDAPDLFAAAAIRMADVDADGRADVCARDGDHLACWRSDGHAFDRAIVGPAWTDAIAAFELADVDGDGQLDACARDANGLSCHVGAQSFARVIELDALSDDAGFADVIHYGSIRFGDIDGDGDDDVCARDAAGLDCWRSEGAHFGERIHGPRWSDDAGFDELPYWSTLRLADIDGDGADDACVRAPEGFRCALARDRFQTVIGGPAMRDEDGWSRTEVYGTLRMADVDGDGRDDVCAREPDGLRCWIASGRGFERAIVGPAWSDDAGFTDPIRFRSIRLADVDGDGRADVCARDAEGLVCATSVNGAFDRIWRAPAWSDERTGLASRAGAASIRIAGGGHPAGTLRDRALFGSVSGCAVARGREGRSGMLLAIALLAWILRRARASRSS